MEGVILDNASLMRCNFEDSKLRPSSLLGAQMKGVNLEVRYLQSIDVCNVSGDILATWRKLMWDRVWNHVWNNGCVEVNFKITTSYILVKVP